MRLKIDGNDKISLYPGKEITVIRWFKRKKYGDKYITSFDYVKRKIVSIDYKNPRARVRVTYPNGKTEHLIYPRNIVI